MPVIDGKELAARLREEARCRAQKLAHPPALDILLVGDQEDSRRYVEMKEKAVEDIGGRCTVHSLTWGSTESLVALTGRLGNDPDVDGILVQLPLPSHIDEAPVLENVPVDKDVDGFHPLNLGRALEGGQVFSACGVLAVMHVIETRVEKKNPSVLIAGSSRDLIKPLAVFLTQRGWDYCLVSEWREGLDAAGFDVVVAENCPPHSLYPGMFAPGALVIDAGFHWLDGKTCGNAVTEEFRAEGTPWLLPVPGGLGPLIISMLLQNLVRAGEMHEN